MARTRSNVTLQNSEIIYGIQCLEKRMLYVPFLNPKTSQVLTENIPSLFTRKV